MDEAKEADSEAPLAQCEKVGCVCVSPSGLLSHVHVCMAGED